MAKGFFYVIDRVTGELISAEKYSMELPKANGGILSTAGNMVLEGTSTGYLKVFQATTGKLLKEIFTGTVIMAAPMTYMVDGE